MKYVCPQGCVEERGMSKPPPEPCPEHGPFAYEKQLKRGGPLRSVSPKRQAEEDTGARPQRRGSTLKQGRGFAASKVQQQKAKGQPCVNCGGDGAEAIIDPAHLWDRGRGGCDDAMCVVALCRSCHDLYDEHALDLLPRLLTCGLFEEIAHPIRAHGVSLTTLLERVTGQRWAPLEPQSNQPKEPAAPERSSE